MEVEEVKGRDDVEIFWDERYLATVFRGREEHFDFEVEIE